LKKPGWNAAFAFLTVCIVLTAQEGLAGVMIDQVMKDREGGLRGHPLFFGERLRTDDVDHGLTTIMDFKGDRMVMVDHRAKNYIEVKFSQWEKEVAEQFKKDLLPFSPGRGGSSSGGGRDSHDQWFSHGEGGGVCRRGADRGELDDPGRDMSEIEKVMERVSRDSHRSFGARWPREGRSTRNLNPTGFRSSSKTLPSPRSEGMSVLEVKKLEQKELSEELFLPPRAMTGQGSVTGRLLKNALQ